MRGPRAFWSLPPMSSHHHNLEPLGRWHATICSNSTGQHQHLLANVISMETKRKTRNSKMGEI